MITIKTRPTVPRSIGLLTTRIVVNRDCIGVVVNGNKPNDHGRDLARERAGRLLRRSRSIAVTDRASARIRSR
jgi:hypothetical protein